MVYSTAGSRVAAAMLNPALLCTVTAAAAEEYARARDEPMPASLAYLVAPLVLHRETREALPRRTNSHWSVWLNAQPVIKAGFAARARSLVGPVRDGLRFGLSHGVLELDHDGGLIGGLTGSARPPAIGDLASVVRSAGFVGKWLTKLERPATAFALLGVEP